MATWWTIVLTSSAASLLLLGAIWRDRSVLLKPSCIFVAYYQISVMWPSLSWLPYIEDVVTNVADYVRAIHYCGLLLTLVMLVTWRRSARRLARKISRLQPGREPMLRIYALGLTGTVLILCVAWYLRTLGWSNTGLAAILQGRENNAEARESAMKLLDSRALQYAWALAATAGAYLCAYFLADTALLAWRQRRLVPLLFCCSAYLAVLFAVMLPGSRSPALMVLITTTFVFYARRSFRGSLVRAAGIVALGLMIPALISLLRNHEPLTVETAWTYYVDILDRVAGRSVEDNIWMVAYAQDQGFFGLQGIPVFARLTGTDPVDIFNTVGRHFRPDGIISISANSSFVAVNYGCFGLLGGTLLSVAVVLLMDATLLLQAGLPRSLAVASTGICAAIAMNFAMTLFTTVLLTHGLLPTIAFCYLLHLLVGHRTRRTLPTTPVPEPAV